MITNNLKTKRLLKHVKNILYICGYTSDIIIHGSAPSPAANIILNVCLDMWIIPKTKKFLTVLTKQKE